MDLEQALRRAKRRQFFKTLGQALAAVVVIGVLAGLAVNRAAAWQMQRTFDSLQVYHQVAEPNVTVGSEMLQNGGLASGNVVTVEYKEVAGIPVPWRTLTSRFTPLSYQLDDTLSERHALNFGTGNATPEQSYTTNTMQKVANFYSDPKALTSNEGLKLAGMTDTFAELAVTFKSPKTLAAVKAWLPANVKLRWGYILDDPSTDANGLANIADPLGVDLTVPLDYKDWRGYLRQYWRGLDPRYANIQPYRTAMAATAKTVRFKGVTLTGSAQALAAVAKRTAVAGSSVGVSVHPAPYQDVW
ncbi:sigma factor regulator N-terminal domain-containing protein [Lacticaseibacillus parakribbianus]|uniref:sigma factor regulator N-terminal domain-containing protein n=1 Tax=Lacticaseibacillus parakribbianus TaxID=2970927 RepID=UPI0021CB15EC|nr:sigma factor regulator N-terminal domain-containing protein [Lacticaseibacillus parakribbianus]